MPKSFYMCLHKMHIVTRRICYKLYNYLFIDDDADELLIFIIIAIVVTTAVMIVAVLITIVFFGKRRWKKYGKQAQEPTYDCPLQLHIPSMSGSGTTFQSPIQLKENMAYTSVHPLPFPPLKENIAYGVFSSQQQENQQHLPVPHN